VEEGTQDWLDEKSGQRIGADDKTCPRRVNAQFLEILLELKESGGGAGRDEEDAVEHDEFF
jgi:hypothetical protein